MKEFIYFTSEDKTMLINNRKRIIWNQEKIFIKLREKVEFHVERL